MSEEYLVKEFGSINVSKQLLAEIYRRYKFIPTKISVEEQPVAVYTSKKEAHIKNTTYPIDLLKGNLVSPSLEAALLYGKYVNKFPFYRLEKELLQDKI